MISWGGYGLGASLPWVLAGIPIGIATLAYIYRQRGLESPRVVSSLFLLRKLPQYERQRKTFLPPLQFWIEVGALCALIAIVSMVYASDSRRHVAIVLDTSKSMSALHPEGSSRLEVAKTYAEIDIREAGGDDRFSIYSADDSLQRVSDKIGDDDESLASEEAILVVKEIRQSFEEDLLGRLVLSLQASGDFEQIRVYTDKRSASLESSSGIVVSSLPINEASLSNLWISDVQLEDRGTTKRSVLVTLRAVGLKEQNVTVTSTCFSERDSAIVQESVKTHTLSDQKNDRVEIPIGQQVSGFCHIVAKKMPSANIDAIESDNHAWIVLNNSTASIELVSMFSPKELKLEGLSRYTFSPRREGLPSATKPTIYHRTSPPDAPSHATLIIAPSKGSTFLNSDLVETIVTKSSSPTRWSESHPILRYVRSGLMKLPKATILDCPVGSEGILHVERGPILCVGSNQGARYVVTGFELFPFEGSKNPTLSILTLNILKYLFDEEVSHTTTQTVPGENTLVQTFKGVDTTIRSTAFPGVYRRVTDVGSSDSLVAINFISDSESDVRAIDTVELAGGNIVPNKSNLQTGRITLEHGLVLIVLVAFCCDLGMRILRRKRWGDSC